MSGFLWLRPLAHRWLNRHSRTASSNRPRVFRHCSLRPCLETLEDRITPSTFTPSVFTDGVTGNPNGTLRDAILAANADTGTTTDTIQLQAGTYTLTLANSLGKHEQENLTGDLNISSTSHALIIQGATDASGNPATIIQQTVLDRVFQIVHPGTTITFENVVIEGGKAQDDGSENAVADSTNAYGGGILDNGDNVTLDNVVLQNNQVQSGAGWEAQGGGIFASGVLTLDTSVIQNNEAVGSEGTSASPNGSGVFGGGIRFVGHTASLTNSTVTGNQALGGNGYSAGNGQGGTAGGGGIAGSPGSGSSITLTDCTVSGNSAISGDSTGTATLSQVIGGGLFFKVANVAFVNSTIADNHAIAGKGSSQMASGGGVGLDGGTATFTNVTVADNTSSAPQGGSSQGGGITNAAASITLVNTLVALNTAATAPDYSGMVSNNSGHNLIGNADGSSGFSAAHGDLLGTTANPLNPQLGSLANNGGPTQTLALLPGSPAINAGNNNAQSVTGPYDQRGPGFVRVVDGTIDIGAFEVQPSPPSPPSGGGTTTPHPSLFQALLSLYIDGAAWEAIYLANKFVYGDNFNIDNFFGTPSQLDTVRANAAAAGINYDTVMSLSRFLSSLRGFYAIQPDIAANAPYAGPFAEFAVIAGAQAVQQAAQLS